MNVIDNKKSLHKEDKWKKKTRMKLQNQAFASQPQPSF